MNRPGMAAQFHIWLVYIYIERDHIDKKEVKSRTRMNFFPFFFFSFFFFYALGSFSGAGGSAIINVQVDVLFLFFMSRESALSTSDPGPPYFLISKGSGCLERFDDRITTTRSKWSQCAYLSLSRSW